MQWNLRHAGAILVIAGMPYLAAATGKASRASKAPEVAPPLAFFMCNGRDMGATAKESAQSCQKRDKRCACTDEMAAPVYGPYSEAAAKARGGDKTFAYCEPNGICYSKEGEAACFEEGTLVSTPTGSIAIQDLRVGDVVISFDEITGERVAGVIAKVMTHKGTTLGDLRLEDGTTLAVTRNHPFYKPETREWVPAHKLSPGDLLLKETSEHLVPVAVSSLAFTRSVENVYNIEVLHYHNYFAAGVLVHNY